MPELVGASVACGLGGLMPSRMAAPFAGAMATTRLYLEAEPVQAPGYWLGEQRTTWLRDVAPRMDQLSALAPGWDSHRARPLDRQVLRDVWMVLERLAEMVPIAPAVVPTVSGGVALEWHRGDIDLEIEFNGRTILASYEDAAGIEAEGPLETLVELVASALSRLR